ncbi:MAG TPA: hypothetical protein VGF59_06510 [Bryobacteraceae bacterium]|jgi:hypothetical protein
MRDIRLGDDIDDFCVRCKRIMNHAVVSVMNGAPAKVRCRTCHSDHDYRHEQAPPPKVDLRKAALFNEVLKKVNPDEPAADPDADEAVEAAGAAEAPEEAAEAAEAAPAPPAKAKAKAKGRAKK